MKKRLSHMNSDGPRMVDVGAKAASARRATATGSVRMSTDALEAIRTTSVPKGDVLGTAQLAGVMAAKRTADLVPLCHSLALTAIDVRCAVDERGGQVSVTATVECQDRTGVEMEALTAVSVACLTLVDMVKAIDPWMTIADVQLEEKIGGRSGRLSRPQPPA